MTRGAGNHVKFPKTFKSVQVPTTCNREMGNARVIVLTIIRLRGALHKQVPRDDEISQLLFEFCNANSVIWRVLQRLTNFLFPAPIPIFSLLLPWRRGAVNYLETAPLLREK